MWPMGVEEIIKMEIWLSNVAKIEKIIIHSVFDTSIHCNSNYLYVNRMVEK